LADLDDPSAMAQLMDTTLRPLEAPDPAQRALSLLPAAAIPLDRIALDAGLSERHLRRACIERTGVSPKYLRRILRFREAAQRLRGGQPSWAQFAAACGYYDQAHFIREFQEFAGCTPGRFLQSRTPAATAQSRHDESTRSRKQNRLH